jgi:glycosyltransferase involved in cell wall biosynthesis
MEYIARQLAPSNRILWVGSVSIRSPKLQMYDIQRIIGRVVDLLSARHLQSNEEILAAKVHPFVIPFYDIPGVRQVNDVMLRYVLRKKMKELGFRDVIAFPSTPLVVDIIGTLGESSSHYFCLDDYTQFDGAYRCVGRLEEKILEKVDSCFAVSDQLMQTRKAKSGENHYLPNGVDIDLFSQSERPLPEELKSVKKPIAGFFGQIGSYVDIDLIVQCAKTYPQVSFVVIGRPHVNVSVFAEASNIIFLGKIPYEKIPYYAHTFDIALNPRVVNKLSLAMSPLKLLEYLSIGMPIVSTDLPAVRKFKNLVNIAETREHFIELIGTALQDTSEEKREARRKIAQQYSWKSIVQGVTEIIERIDMAKHSRQKKKALDTGVSL